jgi:hypothetical protein
MSVEAFCVVGVVVVSGFGFSVSFVGVVKFGSAVGVTVVFRFDFAFVLCKEGFCLEVLEFFVSAVSRFSPVSVIAEFRSDFAFDLCREGFCQEVLEFVLPAISSFSEVTPFTSSLIRVSFFSLPGKVVGTVLE